MKNSVDYCTRVVGSLADIGAPAWNALVEASPAPSPFLRYEFLDALHATGCASARTGWTPRYLTLWHGATLAGAVPLYRKSHSYGEYVFDWAWANAHEERGLAYYPKLLAAVPITPVPGTRLLALDDAARARLATELVAHAQASGLSSLHVLFPTEAEAELLGERGLLRRHGVQFAWVNRGYGSFDDFLAALTQPKRKKLRAERRKVAEAGVTLERKVGRAITDDDWAFFVRCYAATYAAHHSTPYLNLRFFLELADRMPQHLLLTLAHRAGRPIAASFALHDATHLYGRYWGALESVPMLHFEASYYQLIEFAIERGLQTFEGGAQGEHKLARGFEPVVTHSAHWVAEPRLAAAVAHFLQRETGGVGLYVDELEERSALKAPR